MEILLWLAPAGVVLVIMMAWAAWAGRPQRDEVDRSDAAYERFAQAITREHPAAGRPRPAVVRDRSTGIAVRPSRRPGTRSTGPTTRENRRRTA
ncbi:MAG TPA: hypothetical protein VM688_05790 [Nocardioidaceae bacterium]|nr:hypothetical protein [Nocardioidaceae bacterium]